MSLADAGRALRSATAQCLETAELRSGPPVARPDALTRTHPKRTLQREEEVKLPRHTIPHVERYSGLGKILPQIREKRAGPW